MHGRVTADGSTGEMAVVGSGRSRPRTRVKEESVLGEGGREVGQRGYGGGKEKGRGVGVRGNNR